jgi:hypothetical protein
VRRAMGATLGARSPAVMAAIGLLATLAGCGDPKGRINSELSALDRHFADKATSPASAQSWLEHRGYKCVGEPSKFAYEEGSSESALHWTLCTSNVYVARDLVCGYYIEVHLVPQKEPSPRIPLISARIEESCI